MIRYGLLGRRLGHSFSKGFFTQKFQQLGLSDHRYDNFEIEKIDQLPELLANVPDLLGFNVTVPYKSAIIPYLQQLDPVANAVGAVNVVQCRPDGQLWGYNTDVIGLERSLEPFLPYLDPAIEALILGTGGASLACQYVLRKLHLPNDQTGLPFRLVSRNANDDQLSYEDLKYLDWSVQRLIINTTPLGMYPDIDQMPAMPIEQLGEQHIVFDLIYNPESTVLLQRSRLQGAKTLNGLTMLIEQAEAAWKIWLNRPPVHGC